MTVGLRHQLKHIVMKVQYTLVFNRKKDLAAKGKSLVQIQAYLEGGRRYFSTKLYLTQKEWDSKKATCKDPYLAKALRDRVSEFEQFEVEFRALNKQFSLSDFDFFLNPSKKQVPISFTQFFKKQLQKESHLKKGTLVNQENTLKKLIEFQHNIAFEDLDYCFLQDFEIFLRNEKKLKTNTIEKYHRQLRKYINLAIKQDLLPIEKNPYRLFKLSKEETDTLFLLPEERDKIEQLSFDSTPEEKDQLEMARDMFLFACYTGLRFSDCYNMKNSSISKTNQGLLLKYKAQKTEKIGYKPLYLLFDGKPQKIILKYYSGSSEKRVFKGMTNTKVNKCLKVIAKLARIPKKLYFKASRDTFGTSLYMLSGDDKLVQKQLQHTKREQTDKYVHLVEQIQHEGLQKIFKPCQ